ncbi:MAG: glycosyltransferase family 2 protein [Solirubrobacteraceae bacterium]
MPDPLVSVVVPTYRRPARLDQLLISLRAQTLDAATFEVLVVDDGGDPETEEVLRRNRQDGRFALRWIRHQLPQGPAAARNSGWRSAYGGLVAFTDDDCAADPGWLAAALRVATREPTAIIQGITRPDPRELANLGLLARTVCVESLGPHYETCNIFYPRAVLEGLGGFDERFGRRPAAEDTDLAWRAIEHGWTIVLASDAVILHAVERIGMSGMLRVAWRWGPATRVFADHPQVRSMLHRRLFWNVWHYLMWRSLLALAAPRWLRRLLLTRHLLELRGRAYRADAGLWAIPWLIIHDAVECWAVARGAIRHRTLVL